MEERTDVKIQKSILFEADLVSKIESLAIESERDFSGQVRYMLKEYIRIKES